MNTNNLITKIKNINKNEICKKKRLIKSLSNLINDNEQIIDIILGQQGAAIGRISVIVACTNKKIIICGTTTNNVISLDKLDSISGDKGILHDQLMINSGKYQTHIMKIKKNQIDNFISKVSNAQSQIN